MVISALLLHGYLSFRQNPFGTTGRHLVSARSQSRYYRCALVIALLHLPYPGTSPNYRVFVLPPKYPQNFTERTKLVRVFDMLVQ